MGKIAVLSELVRARIAAGEVIERPASAVKELIENSLDAGATRIEIELERGGIRRIRVSDDGEGMDPEDLALCVERFTTSKLRSEEDLMRVTTLGFRGEALGSLAAVAELEIVSRTRASESAFRLRVEPGAPKGPVEPAPGAYGTTVEVRNLFARIPARLKFLRSETVEAAAVAEVVERLALARPDVAFRLKSDGKELFSAPSAGTLRERAMAVLGESAVKDLIELRAGESGWLSIEGLVHAPGAPARKDRRWGFLFLNRRPIRDRVLSHAVESAYVSILPQGQFPTYILYVGIDPGQVDVNIHPSKLEVRFRSSSSVHDFVHARVREALGRAGATIAQPSQARPVPHKAGPPAPRREEGSAARFDLWRGGSLVEESAGDFAGALPLDVRILGTTRCGFVLVETARDLRIVDPHALHERAIYERLRSSTPDRPLGSQMLLVPEIVELGLSELATFERSREALQAMGFLAEPFGGKAVVVRAVPEGVPTAGAAEILREVLSDLEGSGGPSQTSSPEFLERLRRSIACRAAAKLGSGLGQSELLELLKESQKMPGSCPHGRPVAWVLTHEEIARRLGR